MRRGALPSARHVYAADKARSLTGDLDIKMHSISFRKLNPAWITPKSCAGDEH